MPLTSFGLQNMLEYGTSQWDYIGVGTGTTAFTESDTALAAEVERVAVGGLTINNGLATCEAFFTNAQGNPVSGEIQEVGIFDAASGGNLIYRKVLATSVAKTASKGMIVSIVEDIENA